MAKKFNLKLNYILNGIALPVWLNTKTIEKVGYIPLVKDIPSLSTCTIKKHTLNTCYTWRKAIRFNDNYPIPAWIIRFYHEWSLDRQYKTKIMLLGCGSFVFQLNAIQHSAHWTKGGMHIVKRKEFVLRTPQIDGHRQLPSIPPQAHPHETILMDFFSPCAALFWSTRCWVNVGEPIFCPPVFVAVWWFLMVASFFHFPFSDRVDRSSETPLSYRYWG